MFEKKSIEDLKKELKAEKAKCERDSNRARLLEEIERLKAKRRDARFPRLKAMARRMEDMDKKSGIKWTGVDLNA